MFFYLSKILSFLIHPANIVFLALLIGSILLWTKWKKTGRLLVLATGFTAAVITLTPVDSILRSHLENRFPVPMTLPNTVDGIIVLGGAVNPSLSHDRNQLNTNDSSERLFMAAKLAKTYPNAKIIYSGGSGSMLEQDLKESVFAREALLELGIAEDRILFEDQSRNTAENASFSMRIANPKPQEKWLLITSAQHMPRAVGCFRKVDWEIIPYPVDFLLNQSPALSPSIDFANRANGIAHGLHEIMGLFVYWISGKTDTLYPKPDEKI